DKYYYVSRGLEFLAEGERRNDPNLRAGKPSKFPGNPEMRHYMGFYYQLKIGNSDERRTMRSLLDMSLIDPIERDAKKNYLEEKDEQKRNPWLRKFCEDHPRLIRRLREQLNYEKPIEIVRFLDDNKDVPSRFKKVTVPGQKQSDLEEPGR